MRSHHTGLLALPVLLALLGGCRSKDPDDEPAPGAELDEDELAAARARDVEDAREVETQLGLVDDPALQDALRDLVATLHPPAPGEDPVPVKPVVRVLDEATPNAFTLPGRRVYLTRGLLAWIDTDDALALVAAHAVGHDGHKATRPTRDERWSAGVGLAAPLLEAFAKLGELPGRGVGRISRGFDLLDEGKADERAIDRVARAGFDPTPGVTLLDRLDALGGGEALPTWPSTHPAPSRPTVALLTRARRVQAESGAPARPSDARAREAALRRLEGLAYGPDPRRGYQETGWLIHPRGKFRLPVPGRWRLRSTTTQVQLAAPDGDAIVVVDTGVEETTPGAAADRWNDLRGVDVDVDRELKIDGKPAVRLVSRASSAEGPLVVISTFVLLNGRVVALHGVAPKESWEDRRPQLIAMHDGFAAYEDALALDVHPATLHIHEVERDAPLREVLAAWPIPERVDLDVAGLASLNARKLDEVVPAGTLVKVLRRGR